MGGGIVMTWPTDDHRFGRRNSTTRMARWSTERIKRTRRTMITMFAPITRDPTLGPRGLPFTAGRSNSVTRLGIIEAVIVEQAGTRRANRNAEVLLDTPVEDTEWDPRGPTTGSTIRGIAPGTTIQLKTDSITRNRRRTMKTAPTGIVLGGKTGGNTESVSLDTTGASMVGRDIAPATRNHRGD